MTAMLAMLYLSLFSTLAVGFYGAVASSVQLASNDQHIADANFAADSGMGFMRYQLYQLTIPIGTTQDQYLACAYSNSTTQDLTHLLLGTTNFQGQNISFDGTTIKIPSSGTIAVDANGNSFNATVTQNGPNLRARIFGHANNSSVSRIIQLDYNIAQKASAIFNYGVASKGTITMNGNTKIQGSPDPAMGSVLSADTATNTPISMTGSTSISGDVAMVSDQGAILVTGSPTVAGYTVTTSQSDPWAQHVHDGVTPPQFPTIDTSSFKQYATNVMTTAPAANQKNFTNLYIKAGVNPQFAANTVITGVLYIETPNNVTFKGGVSIQGVVVEQASGSGSPSTNSINFTGNVTAQSVSTLPSTYGGLKSLTGAFILAPDFAVNMSGNFGTIGGSIVAGSLSLTGNAGGTINGTAIVMNGDANFSGNSDMIINSQGVNQFPAGVSFGQHFTPLPATYDEPLQ